MKRILLSTVAVLALGATVANAADIQRRVVTKAPATYVEPVFSWTGPYIGINGGGAWGTGTNNGAFPGSRDISGGMIGATLGYNWQVGQLVLGVEGDIDWARIRGSGPCGVGFSCTTEGNWMGTIRGRLGYAAGRIMPYVTGGVAVVGLRNTIAGVGSASSTEAGWTAGLGVEAALWSNWSAKLEYLYVDAGRGATVAGSSTDFRANIVRAGLNYRF